MCTFFYMALSPKWEKKLWEKKIYFQWKSSFKNQGVAHGENILWTKSYITYDIV